MLPSSIISLPRPLRAAAFFSISLSFLFSSQAQATEAQENFMVRMSAEAEGVGASAKKMAIELAQQQIITEVIQSLTNSTDLAPFRGLLRQASAYIARYDLLRNDISGTMTQVEIDAQVREKPLRQDIAAIMLPRLPRHPSILLLLAEQTESTAAVQAGGGPAAQTLGEGLKKFGFSVAGLESLGGVYSAERLGQVIGGGVEEGSRFARENLYDVVIIGSGAITQEPIRSESNLLRSHATVTLRFFSGNDGKMTDDLTAEAIVSSVDAKEGGEQSLTDAANKLVGDTTVAIVLAMLARQDKEQVILNIDGPIDSASVEALSSQLTNLLAVNLVEILFTSEKLARIRLDYTDSMSVLADFLNTTRINDQKISIERAVGREITLRFLPQDPSEKP